MKVSTRKKVACLIVVSCTTIHTTVVGFTIPTTLSTRQGTQRFSSPPQTHPASKDSTCQSGESSSWTRQSTRLYYGTSSRPSETPRGEARRPFPRVDHEANGSTSSTTQKSQEQGIGQQDFRNAIQWTMGWVAAATTFGLGLAVFEGLQASQEYFTTYLLELSLSVDNLMVFMYLFQQFQIPTQYQNKVLNWGIGGAMIFRAIMIGLGTSVMHRLHGVQLAFAAMLLITAFQLATKQISTKSSNTNKSTSSTSTMSMDATMTTSKMNFARDCRDEAKNFYENKVRFSPTLDGDRFFTRTKFGELLPTPLFQCLAAVEGADIAFAMDSIPAGLAVTTNPLILFSSNMFAIIGLRSLYTVLSKVAMEFKYMDATMSILLGFVGSKMVVEYYGTTIPTTASLGFVLMVLGGSIGLSWWDEKQQQQIQPQLQGQEEEPRESKQDAMGQ